MLRKNRFFFELLMQRGNQYFEIDSTPTVILTFFKGGVNYGHLGPLTMMNIIMKEHLIAFNALRHEWGKALQLYTHKLPINRPRRPASNI